MEQSSGSKDTKPIEEPEESWDVGNFAVSQKLADPGEIARVTRFIWALKTDSVLLRLLLKTNVATPGSSCLNTLPIAPDMFSPVFS
jgi:hypothetical protein